MRVSGPSHNQIEKVLGQNGWEWFLGALKPIIEISVPYKGWKNGSKNSIENISVECEATRTYFKQENLITDTIAIKENFTIYSID